MMAKYKLTFTLTSEQYRLMIDGLSRQPKYEEREFGVLAAKQNAAANKRAKSWVQGHYRWVKKIRDQIIRGSVSDGDYVRGEVVLDEYAIELPFSGLSDLLGDIREERLVCLCEQPPGLERDKFMTDSENRIKSIEHIKSLLTINNAGEES